MTSSSSAPTKTTTTTGRTGEQDVAGRIMSPRKPSGLTSSPRPSYRISCERHPYTLGHVMFDDSDSDSDEDDILGYNDLSSQAHRRNRSETLEMLRRRLAQIELLVDLTSACTAQISGSKHNLPLDGDTAGRKNARSEITCTGSPVMLSPVSSDDQEQKEQPNRPKSKNGTK